VSLLILDSSRSIRLVFTVSVAADACFQILKCACDKV
jgi:hypothetical protein